MVICFMWERRDVVKLYMAAVRCGKIFYVGAVVCGKLFYVGAGRCGKCFIYGQ